MNISKATMCKLRENAIKSFKQFSDKRGTYYNDNLDNPVRVLVRVPQLIKGCVQQKRDCVCVVVVPVIYDIEIHGPCIKTQRCFTRQKKERTMSSSHAHMNTHSKSSSVLDTINARVKRLQSKHVLYFVNKIDNRNIIASTISNHLLKHKGYTFE